jgi:CcmD family protein
MFKKIYYLLLCMAGLAISLTSNAQDSATTKKVEMADAFRTNGKIFVVIAVLITILLGLMLYMIRLDRKIGRLEKETKK